MDVPPVADASLRRPAQPLLSPARHVGWLPLRSLGVRHRRRIAEHLRRLSGRDRYLRFGFQATDEQIDRYVAGIDFARDELFGVFNRRLTLIALAHLAFEGAPAGPDGSSAAEFGASVAPASRGRGFGARLFAHATLRARNRGVDTLLIHALSENAAMLRIARTAGAQIVRDGGEAQARLRLPADTFASHLDAAFERSAAEIDFHLKRHVRLVDNWWEGMAEVNACIEAED